MGYIRYNPISWVTFETIQYITIIGGHCRHYIIWRDTLEVYKAPSSMSGEYIYSGGFWDSKACAVCARWDRSGAAAPNSAPKIVWQFLEPSLVLLQQSTDQSEKSCEDNLPVSSNISKPNSAPKRCDRIGSALVATCVGSGVCLHCWMFPVRRKLYSQVSSSLSGCKPLPSLLEPETL